MRGWLPLVGVGLICVAGGAWAQAGPQQPKDMGKFIDDAMRASSLTQASKPFHLVLDIHPGKVLFPGHQATSDMSGSMEIFWVSAARYKLVVQSPGFSQTKIVEGDKVEEHDTGDFYPRWLDNFVRAFFEPLPHVEEFRSSHLRMSGGGIMRIPGRNDITMPRCIEKTDRPGGITDETAESRICFDASHDWVQGGLDFTRYVSLSDYKSFEGQQIPRLWSDDIPENIYVEGKVVKLEKLSDGDARGIHVSQPTAPDGQMKTVFLSRQKIEELLEPLPEYEWPAENAEKLEGYMIVYVRTDRTGKVRESYWDSSDNYQLQNAGVKLALMAKLKPLVVDGVPVQIEGPLVLHFKTHREGAGSQ
jgi:hypothetical protein